MKVNLQNTFPGSFDFLGLNHYTTAMFTHQPDSVDPVGTFDNDKNTKALPYPDNWVGYVAVNLVYLKPLVFMIYFLLSIIFVLKAKLVRQFQRMCC